MRRNLALTLALTLGILSFGYVTGQIAHVSAETTLESQSQPLGNTIYFQGVHRTATTQTATGQTAAISMRGIAISHSIGLVVTGSPTGCTYRLQGSRDGTNWFNISATDITCTSTTASYEANKPWPQVRGNLLTLSGGTSPTVTLHYAGK